MRPLLPTHPPIRLPPAFVVSVPAPYFIRHYGIVSERLVDDAPTVISLPNNKDGAQEETWADFAKTDLVRVNAVRVEGYLGQLPPEEVLRRARSCFGLPWTFSFNCEHFVTWAHGLPPRSPQLESWIAAGGLGLLLSKLWR